MMRIITGRYRSDLAEILKELIPVCDRGQKRCAEAERIRDRVDSENKESRRDAHNLTKRTRC